MRFTPPMTPLICRAMNIVRNIFPKSSRSCNPKGRAMRTYPFMQVDAFTTRPLGGNPCAIVFDADDLDAATMQAIARENNLSETAFVLRSQIADVRARYFTPESEIPLA